MPFRNLARLKIKNGNDFPIGLDIYANVTRDLKFDENTTGILHAKFMQEFVTYGVPHQWLTAKNDKGHFVGVVQAMVSPRPEDVPSYIRDEDYQPLSFLEGDEQF